MEPSTDSNCKSTANTSPQYGRSVTRDDMHRPLLRKRTQTPNDGRDSDGQGARSYPVYLPRPPEHRHGGNDVRRKPVLPVGEVINVNARGFYRPRSYAVHRMPPEILCIIFENCFDEREPSRAALSDPPLLLGRICSYWRSVAHRTTRLWTSLSLRFLETKVDRSRDGISVAAAVETWLDRSYPFPLSLAYTDNRIFQKDTEDAVIWLLSCIRMRAPRWRSIYLKFSSDYFTQLDLLSSCAFTSLVSFSVHIDHMGWRRGLLSLSLDLSKASRLKSLAYTGPDHVVREEILVDWESLTSIALSYDLHEAGGQSVTLPRYFSTLASCWNLTELSIGLSLSLAQHLQIAQVHTVTPLIELPRLHTLRVRRLSRSAHACALIDAFVFPQLSTLEIDSAVLVGWDNSLAPFPHPDLHPPLLPHAQTHTQTSLWHAHYFSALLARSGCRLHTLRIRDVDMSPAELTRLLTSSGTSFTLSTFTFEPYPRAYPISDVLAHLMSVPSPDAVSAASPSLSPSSIPSSSTIPSPVLTRDLPSLSLPSLTQLRLGCAHETHLGPLADIIESRTGARATHAGVRPLAVFELVFYDFVYGRGQARQPRRKMCFDAFKERVLRCAREGGVDVEIRVERPYEPVYLSVL